MLARLMKLFAQSDKFCAVSFYCLLRRCLFRVPICRWFGTEAEPAGPGPNQGSGRFGYYFGYLTTQVRVVNSGPGNPGIH